MPTYLYRCPDCLNKEEIKHGMNEELTIKCVHFMCKGVMKKIITASHSGMSSKFFEGNTWEDTKYRRY